jgi:glucan biosynthesis protein C
MTASADRRPDIDWLRVLATLLVVVFHTAMVFNPAPFYHIRNSDLSFLMVVFCGFVSLWHMPLFFVLAGWSLARVSGLRSAGEVLNERLRRIGVPLVAGVVLFMPAIKYLELRSGLDLNHRGLWITEALQPGFKTVIPTGLPTMPEFHDSFGQFFPTFFTNLDRFTWAHLWFIAYLLTFTVLLLPVFARWARAERTRFDLRPWMVWAPVPLLALIQVMLRPHWPGIQNLYNDWANVAWYLTYLCAGFALGWDPRLEEFVHSQWKRALAVGLATCGVLLGGITGLYQSDTVLLAGSAVAGWAFLVAILGAGRRWLSFSSPTLRYLAEAALPIYILHQAAIVIPGFWLVQLPLGIAAKLLLVLGVAYLLIFGVYHFLVRPLQPVRILFGMRPLACQLRKPRVAVAGGTAAALLMLAVAQPSDASASPIGVWYAEGGAAQVEVRDCGDALCGRVVWLRSPFDENGCPMSDRFNPDESLRGRSVIGIDLLSGLQPVPGEAWDGGTIYDPTSGRTYRCTMSMAGDDRLMVRGYMGFHILGRTTTWIRVGTEDLRCQASRADEDRS